MLFNDGIKILTNLPLPGPIEPEIHNHVDVTNPGTPEPPGAAIFPLFVISVFVE